MSTRSDVESAVEGAVEVIACATCGGAERDAEGRTKGEQLFAELRAARGDASRVSVSSVRCLWACKNRCTVHVRGPGRFGYVIGQLEPTGEHARAVLDYALLYAESAEGTVPFRQVPQPLKGHFVCRIPKPSDTAPPERAEPSAED